MKANPYYAKVVKAYIKPSIETIEIELEGSILDGSGSGSGEDVDIEDTDF